MLNRFCKIAIVLSVSALVLSAADPMLGTWKLNTAKSKFHPGPGPKSSTLTYTRDGDWIVGKSEGINPEGKPYTRANRYKADGNPYPYDGPAGKGTIAFKKLNEYEFESVVKLDGGGTTTGRSVYSKDGKTRTLTTTGTNAKGEKIHSVAVSDKQ